MLDNGKIGKRAVRFRRPDCQVNTDARRLEKWKSEGLDCNCIMHAYADQQIAFGTPCRIIRGKRKERKNQIAVRACFFTRFYHRCDYVRSTCRETRLSPKETHSQLQIIFDIDFDKSVPKIVVGEVVVVVLNSYEQNPQFCHLRHTNSIG